MFRPFRAALGACGGIVLALVLAAAAAPPAQPAGNTTFSGRATVLQGTVLGQPIPCLASVNNLSLVPQAPRDNCRGVADTGPVAASGGHLEASLLCYPASNDPSCVLSLPDLTDGMVRSTTLHAVVVSHGKTSSASTFVESFGVNAAGQTVTGEVLAANAQATCQNGSVALSASSQIVNLKVNETPIVVATDANDVVLPNQEFPLPGGVVLIVNKQTEFVDASTGDKGIRVTALDVFVPGPVPGTDTHLIVGQAEADIACAALPECPGQHQFVTSGGYIYWPPASTTKAHFVVAGRDTTTGAAPWGHVIYKPTGLHVKNPFAVVFFRQFSALKNALNQTSPVLFPELQRVRDNLGTLTNKSSSFQGAAILYWTANGQAKSDTNPIVGEALAIDMGEPGNQPKGFDFFEIAGLQGNPAALVSLAGGFLQGGNIQMHGKC